MLLLTCALSPGARAQQAPELTQPAQLPSRQANYAWDKALLRASFSFRDVMDKALIDRLPSGVPIVIAMRAYVFREGDTTPVALAARICRAAYDVWDEVYRLKITAMGVERDTATISAEGVLRQCVEARDLPIIDRPLLTAGKTHFLGVIVEVNPYSPEMLAHVRQWITRPQGSAGIGPGDALFGSVVGLFARGPKKTADKTLTFRTQAFTP